MTKRKTTTMFQDNRPDYLIKPKKQFEIDLVERIRIGEELSNSGNLIIYT